LCVKLEKNASDTCAMLSEAYGGEDKKKSSVFFESHKRFNEGRENVENNKIIGRPTSHRTDEILKNCGM